MTCLIALVAVLGFVFLIFEFVKPEERQ